MSTMPREQPSMMRRIKAIVFDLDDTLYPERAYVQSGFRAVAAALAELLGDPALTLSHMLRLFEGPHRERVFDALLKERLGHVDREILRSMVSTYRNHAPVLTPYSDVESALTRLRGRYKLGLITDGRREAQWGKIEALHLRTRLDHIIVTSDLRPCEDYTAPDGAPTECFAKPHPRAFEEMAKALGASASACAYVADNPAKDFVSPNALGWLTVRILRPDALYASAGCAPDGEALRVIESLDGIERVMTDAP